MWKDHTFAKFLVRLTHLPFDHFVNSLRPATIGKRSAVVNEGELKIGQGRGLAEGRRVELQATQWEIHMARIRLRT